MPFRVLVASDGSPSARAAVATSVIFPWPRDTRAHGLVAWGLDAPPGRLKRVVDVLVRNATRISADARRVLGRRWPKAEVVVSHRAPVAAIVDEARRLRAGAIVVGWRGHGAFRRLLMGSVSRDVVRRAGRPVLVVRRRPRDARTFVVGTDGSANARRAVRFLATLAPPRGGQVTVVRIEEPMPTPISIGRFPASIRAILRSEVAKINGERLARARRDVDAAAAMLARRGWRVRKSVGLGTPLFELMRTVAASRAGVLVVGARGRGGIERLLLGSVAEGALNQSPVPVLVVR